MKKARKRSRRSKPSGFAKIQGFVQNYTEGVSTGELRRLFQEEAQTAYAVLTRDQRAEPSTGDQVRQTLRGARRLFLGLSYKLTPARRLLFAAALVLLALGLVSGDFRLAWQGFSLTVDFSPTFFIASIAALIFVLALELVDRVRVRDELEVARQLQAEILPQKTPSLDGYRIAHSYRTANTVGGDYYDFPLLAAPSSATEQPEPSAERAERVALVIGDASGHGIAAGLLMAIADATVKTALDLDPSPDAVAALLNRALCRTGGQRAFMTLFYGLFDPASGALDYLCAGHPFPLLRRRDGSVIELGEGGLPLGLRHGLTPPTGRVSLEPGDSLILYTDGLAEALDSRGEAFGFDPLRKLVEEGGGASALHDRLLASFDRHRGEVPLNDDVTLVVVERRG